MEQEQPVSDKELELARRMAEAEKPYREMAAIAFKYDNTDVRNTGLDLLESARDASSKIEQSELYEDPDRYLALIRQYAHGAEAVTRINSSQDRRHFSALAIRGVTTRYAESHNGDEGYDLRHMSDGLLASLARHIEGFAVLSRRINITQNSRLLSLREIPDADANNIHDAIASEWMEYLATVVEYGGSLDDVSSSDRPLLYTSVGELQSALGEDRDRYSELTSQEIMEIFSQSSDFRKECDAFSRRKVEQRIKSELRQQRVLEAREERRKVQRRAISVEHQESDNEQEREFIETNEVDRMIEIDDPQRVDTILKAIGGAIAQDKADQFGEYVREKGLFAGFNTDFTERIRPEGFHGRLRNIRMIRLPLDDVFREKVSHRLSSNDAELVSRIGVVADMYSTGRGKIGESMQEYVYQVSNPSNPVSRKVRVFEHTNLSGKKLAQYVREQSAGIATIIEAYHSTNPLGGGAPGLGKR